MGRGREGEDEGFSCLAQLWNPPLALTQALELPLALTPESKDINSERHGLAPAGLERGGTCAVAAVHAPGASVTSGQIS